MEGKKLSGIERDLVLQYLIDGNVPVTLTLLDEKNNDNSTFDGFRPVLRLLPERTCHESKSDILRQH